MLCIGYVEFKWVCICSAFLRKLDSPLNRSQDNYNHDRYRGENQNCEYWPILGSYNNWKIIHCIDGRKQHESTNTDINAYIKKNFIRNIALNIGKDISDRNYGSVSKFETM